MCREATVDVASVASVHSIINRRERPIAVDLPGAKRLKRAVSPCASHEHEHNSMHQIIERKLKERFQPTLLVVMDETSKHTSHLDNVAVEDLRAETHFRIEVVSDSFAGKPRLQRHRMVFAALGDELRAGVHALFLNVKTPAEVERRRDCVGTA
mmetsp:Transcript_28300/g.62007  ORF Transcript_28300/g.62007 Transcript_28300/m.62007 type:complete len:154 (-) Transcript_28300:332-793(-)